MKLCSSDSRPQAGHKAVIPQNQAGVRMSSMVVQLSAWGNIQTKDTGRRGTQSLATLLS